MSDTTARRTPSSAAPPLQSAVFNVPNQLSIARLVLAVVCFVMLALAYYGSALVVFILAAATDWVDGFWARRYGQITQLGRILDPFADKIVVCGTFIFLAAIPQSQIKPWMAVVVVGRELLVTGLRSFFEERGIDFSAKWAGKWKMLFQCAAICVSLYLLTYLDHATGQWATEPADWMITTLVLLVWTAVVLTVYSGWGYVQAALRLLKG